ncbi:unnamed protein product [Clonostachys rosea f. rosea IK726]|uniref:Uncharacterized protein n=1 Tax=Clonostachys rosea f. rosea IK726 TaxID=1349383 RepID=A0ACA9UA33_BIOOC|nr:unnamed protein product [Clonostachys rosea f. rosea IK726]
MPTPRRSLPSESELREFYVGRDINSLPKPAIVLDVAKASRHAAQMLEAAQSLRVAFRAHVKTHKTTQLARMQVGESPDAARFVVSTVAELEHMTPVFEDFTRNGRPVDVLYGIPIPPSQIVRIAKIAVRLRLVSISFLVDHPSQLASLSEFYDLVGSPASVFLKVDTGYHRAGLPPSSLNKQGLIQETAQLESQGKAVLAGLYSHSSLSYKDTTAEQAMDNLASEIDGCLEAIAVNAQHFPKDKKLIVSVGASPQVTSIQNFAPSSGNAPTGKLATSLQHMSLHPGVELELHAGVYSVLDVQQLSTNSRTSLGSFDDEIAVSVVAEVVSVYNDGERSQPEALVAVGVLGLGREPAAYGGWGVLSRASYHSAGDADGRRLILERISQEHAIVAWEKTEGDDEIGHLPPIPLEVGRTVSIFPNHACITGAMYDWYLVVDSSSGSPTRVIDVWVRASGW